MEPRQNCGPEDFTDEQQSWRPTQGQESHTVQSQHSISGTPGKVVGLMSGVLSRGLFCRVIGW